MSLPTELLEQIFSYTNVATVISGRRVCKYYNKWLKSTQELLMRPDNMIFTDPRNIYDQDYINKLKLVNYQRQPYILGSVSTKLFIKHKGFSGFTLLCHFKLTGSRKHVLFGYSKYHYVIYAFKETNMGFISLLVGESRLLFMQRRIVNNLSGLEEVLTTLTGKRNINLDIPIYCIYDIVRNLPNNKARYTIVTTEREYIPYTSSKNGLLYNSSYHASFFRSIYTDSPQLLGQLLRERGKVGSIFDNEAFKEHRQILIVFERCYNTYIRYGSRSDTRLVITTNPKLYPGYYSIATYLLGKLDTKSDPKELAQNFDKIPNPTEEIISIVLSYYANCGTPAIGVHMVDYIIEHNMKNELIIFSSHVILYYARGKEVAEELVIDWLSTVSVIGNVWRTNWQWYSDNLQNLLSARML
jgi:hypothetical protein